MTDTDLRWRLRQLPRELDPDRDLWPDIAARLPMPAARRRSAWPAWMAMAASVLLAVAWWRLAPPPDPQRRTDEATERIVQAEAAAMTREYQAALSEYRAMPVPAELVPSIATLDRSVADIRSALARDTDSVLLLQQLQRAYSRRLALTQRVATS
jgi:hypothetical protein